jgi:hypothetical protein
LKSNPKTSIILFLAVIFCKTSALIFAKSKGVIEQVHLTMGDMLCTMAFLGEDWFQDMQHALMQ